MGVGFVQGSAGDHHGEVGNVGRLRPDGTSFFSISVANFIT
jgi:hypothetical protein